MNDRRTLEDWAARCRRLALHVSDKDANSLRTLADEYEQRARDIPPDVDRSPKSQA
jgi:hypothetical protein